MKYKLLAKITLDRVYNEGETIADWAMGQYLEYYQSIGVLQEIEELEPVQEELEEKAPELVKKPVDDKKSKAK